MEYDKMLDLFMKLENFIKQRPNAFGTRQKMVNSKLVRNYDEAKEVINSYAAYKRGRTTIDRLILKIFLMRYEQSNIVIQNLHGDKMHIKDIFCHRCRLRPANIKEKVQALDLFIQNKL